MVIELEENDILQDSSRTLINIDDNERKIRRSVVAYLMWHSGHVFTEDPTTDSKLRGMILDDYSVAAINRMEKLGMVVNTIRKKSTGSIIKQVDNSKNPNIPVCYIDVESLESETILPIKQPNNTTLVPPKQVLQANITEYKAWKEFRDRYNQLGTHIITAPKSVIHWIRYFEKEFLDIADPRIGERSKFHRIEPEWRFVNPPSRCTRTFDTLSGGIDVGRLVEINGQVIEVAEPKIILTHIAYRCITRNEFGLQCGNIQLEEQNQEAGVILKPMQCSCGGKQFVRMESSESKNESMCRINIQEEEVSEEPKTLMVELRGTLLSSITAGSIIKVVGIVRVEPVSKNNVYCDQYLLASYIEQTRDRDLITDISQKDLEEIKAFEDSMNLKERMDLVSKSWAGNIFGLEDIKTALILQACGSPEEQNFGHRKGIHILLVGDPGTAKSKLLKLSTRLRSGNRYTSAEGLSFPGLMAACNRVEDPYTGSKKWAIKPGVLCLVSEDGVCAIDEFNLYNKGSGFGEFNNPMEHGEVIIDKIVKAKIPSKCGILAGANPTGRDADRKKFSKGSQVPFVRQIGMPFTILQRFDAIYIIIDVADFDTDKSVSKSMTKGMVEESPNEKKESLLSIEFIQKLIAVCRSRDVKLSKKVDEYISETHARKRSEAKDDESLRSHRQVISMARFTAAVARFDDKKVATLEHTRFAEKILENTLQERDPGVVDGGRTEDSRNIRLMVAENFAGLLKTAFMLEDRKFSEIYGELSKTWTNIAAMDEVEEILNSFTKNKMITNLTRSKDGYYCYDGVDNPVWHLW